MLQTKEGLHAIVIGHFSEIDRREDICHCSTEESFRWVS